MRQKFSFQRFAALLQLFPHVISSTWVTHHAIRLRKRLIIIVRQITRGNELDFRLWWSPRFSCFRLVKSGGRIEAFLFRDCDLTVIEGAEWVMRSKLFCCSPKRQKDQMSLKSKSWCRIQRPCCCLFLSSYHPSFVITIFILDVCFMKSRQANKMKII